MTCRKAKQSIHAVRYPSTTGSRSYEVTCNIVEGDAFQLFKATHYSRTRGFTSPVKAAIVSPSKLCTTLNSAIYLIDYSRYLLRYTFLNCAANSHGQILGLCLWSDSSYACMLTSLPSACRYIIAICYLHLCLCMQIPCHFSTVSNLCSVQACLSAIQSIFLTCCQSRIYMSVPYTIVQLLFPPLL